MKANWKSDMEESKTGKESLEMRFFITSLTDASKASEAMCSHWGVENGLHWELDIFFGEDLSNCEKIIQLPI